MQQSSCEDLQLLISKYADDAATPSEREAVDRHTAVCDKCACKLTEYMEMAAIFSESPMHLPDPHLRAGVLKEIGRLHEEKRKAEVQIKEREWQKLPSLPQLLGRQSSLASFFKTVGPFAFATASVSALFLFIVLNAGILTVSTEPDQQKNTTSNVLPPPGPPVPTIPATIMVIHTSANIPGPEQTKVGLASPLPVNSTYSAFPSVPVAATRSRTAILKLLHSTPVLELGDVKKASTWHVLRDPDYGYTISYPPNWWTYTQGSTRYFYPWNAGGTKDAPYSIVMRVEDNPQGYDAQRAKQMLFGNSASCQVVKSGREGLPCLRRSTSGANDASDELYSFDLRHIYVLRVSVPRNKSLGLFEDRWDAAQDVFSRMSTSISLPSDLADRSVSSDHVLFLNGTDLWSVDANGNNVEPLTRGYVVADYALSPDMRTVAFTAKSSPSEVWSKYLYLSSIDASGQSSVSLLWTGGEIHDIAWYGDHDLLAIANTPQGGLGIYRLSVPIGRLLSTASIPAYTVVKLNESLNGARGLAVSPDRQLITFLAPIGENTGTDVYAVRPDGSDLITLVSHADPISPIVGNDPILPAESQAIKSYLWVSGSLERDGYQYKMLFTCGNSSSPSLYKGGFLYSAPGSMSRPLIDPYQLGVSDPAKLQIIHVAYSQHGKVAFTGYYNDRDGRTDLLAGLWTADMRDESLANIKPQPLPESPHGATDLQWTADGTNLIYRETIPNSPFSSSSHYDGVSGFRIVKLDPTIGNKDKVVLYSTSR